MKLSGLLKWIGFFTFVALVYIHMQMNIIHLAYEGKNKERAIRTLNEDNGYLTYTILSIKSSSNLGYKMLSEESNMDFMDPQDIMFISATEESGNNKVMAVANAENLNSNFFNNLFLFGARAEARGLE